MLFLREVIWNALASSFPDLGTNAFGWIVGLVAPFAVLILKAKHAPKGSRIQLIKAEWRSELRDIVLFYFFVWMAVFIWEMGWDIPHIIRTEANAIRPPVEPFLPPTGIAHFPADHYWRSTTQPSLASGSRPYCTPAPSGPRIREGSDPFCEFNDGELTVFADNIAARLDEAVRRYEQETSTLDHGAGRRTDMARLIPNIHLKDTYSQCCYSLISPLRAELIKRLPGGATVELLFPLSNPNTWFDLGQEPQTVELDMASRELKQLNNQLKAKVRSKRP